MKKLLVLFGLIVLVSSVVYSGGNQDQGNSKKMKVGMVTDTGTIDDKSFNQGTWEGILRAAEEGLVEEKYLRPSGSTEADYIKEISNLYDAGYRFIITPGYKFETAIFVAQNKYPDAKFVLIDGSPHSGDSVAAVGENTVSIFFAEHESGFYSGVATALQLGEGEAGFLGGMSIPPVQKFNWGFQQGVAYANANFGTKVNIKSENVVYQGTFDDVAAGQQLAAGMFDKGVDVIFCAAGGVGVGAINEAKARTINGEEVWIVGVDGDQYDDGIYAGSQSVILTSAMKRVDNAAYDMIMAEIDNTFPGGQTIRLDSSKGGVSIPTVNPNLDADVIEQVNQITKMVMDNSITVSPVQGDLIP